MGTTTARRPGISFETRTPSVLSPLPRMDIAAFVGFAPVGPVNVPVAVEDPARYHDVFGEDLELARDDRGELVYAELPAAVRAFFRNGGVRCWVVRVASEARANHYVLPGLLAAERGSAEVAAAVAEARSPGSWSDSLTVNTSISLRPLAILSPGSPPGFAVGGIAPGDLVQVDYPSLRIVAFQEVRADRTRRPLTVDVPEASHWFRAAVRSDFEPTAPSPPPATSWLPAPLVVRWLSGAGAADPALSSARWGIDEDGFILELDRTELRGVQPGSWLRVQLASPPAGATDVLLLQVDRFHAPSDDQAPTSPEPVWIRAARGWSVLDAAVAAAEVAGVEPKASLVTFELWARDPTRRTVRLADLGLTDAHDRYWGHLPNDDVVFSRDARRPSRQDRVPASLLKEVHNPRFPLAAARPGALSLPLGMTGLPRDEFHQAALPHGMSARARDGLLALTKDLFLDRELDPPGEAINTTRLLSEAFQIQYVNEYGPPTSRVVGRDLTGLHALLPIEEIAFMAVPDALHRSWRQEPSAFAPLDPPTLTEVSVGPEKVHVGWVPPGSPAEDGLIYTVEACLAPRFDVVARAWTVEDVELDHAADLFSGCPVSVFYRVRAQSATLGRSPWSNTLRGIEPSSAFARCPEQQPAAPDPVTVTEERGRLIVEWGALAGDAQYTLERASDEDFASATVVYRGPSRKYEVLRGPERVVYFRVAAEQEACRSPWSRTVRAGRIESVAFVTDAAADYDADLLLRVQAAAARMCAARGDLHTVLGLPLHFRDDHAIAYAARLSTELAKDEPRVASYAALFHPWVVVRETSGRADLSRWPIAPDGPVAGAIAARTLRNGAWLSPANQLLRGVVDLQPGLGDAAFGLLGGRVNPIWQQPRGFSAADALTLHPGDELGELHVRRLLILLRRVVMREGPAMVFRPNDDSLRRLVQREFEQVLADLFVRGAFAGETHDEGYRVVADATVNTPQSADLGRFVVELQVAPSHPLSFLTVRLVQEGGTLLGVQED